MGGGRSNVTAIIIEAMVFLRTVRLLAASLVLATVIAGCHSAAPGARSTGSPKSFHVRGRILAVKGGDVMLNHEAVPGFKEAMTMSYHLKDPSIASELHAGDRIAATILVTQESNGEFANPQLDEVVVTAQARPDYKPTVQYHVPKPGDKVPDFALLNQSGHMVHLDQFRGKLLLATFIYTRCTLADFCPRMSRNFAAIDQALAADPKLYAATHLLSISFDPAYDTPQVLRTYGGSYTGRFNNETFAHWDFAAPPLTELPTVAQFFGVGIVPGDSGSLTHSLSTVLIGRDGTIIAWYPTNDWTPADLVDTIKQHVTKTA